MKHMKRYILLPLLAAAIAVQAQDSYMNERLVNSSSDVIGTSRYVGMGGALGALGADISVDGTQAVLRGVKELRGETLTAPDLRGGAAMVVAGLTARGETRVVDAGHIARGYESFDDRLCALGADVWIEHKGKGTYEDASQPDQPAAFQQARRV